MKISLTLASLHVVSARLRTQYYPVQARSLETPQYSLEEFLEEFQLTFSDDSPPKVLEPFCIDVFPTKGVLPEESLMRFEQVMDSFLTEELSKIYSKRPQIHTTTTRVGGQSAISKSTMRRLQRLSVTDGVAVVGTQFETQVNVTFQNDPSPSTEVVQAIVEGILGGDLEALSQDLIENTQEDENFGTSLDAALAGKDGGVGGGVAPGVTSTQPRDQDSDRNLGIIVPLTVGACALFALIALFALRKRRERTLREDGSHELNDMIGDVDVFIGDDDSDIFSFEAALSPRKTPRGGTAPSLASSTRSSARSSSSGGLSPIEEQSVDQTSVQESDIFSGLNESPRHASSSKSVFSIFSGFSRATNADSSTVVASNTANRKVGISPVVADTIGKKAGKNALAMSQNGSGKRSAGTPGSKISSLFTFSEEDEESDCSSNCLGSKNKVTISEENNSERIIPSPVPLSSAETSKKPRNGDILTPRSDLPSPSPPSSPPDDQGSSIVGLAADIGNTKKDGSKASKLNFSRLACGTPEPIDEPETQKGFFSRKWTSNNKADKEAINAADNMDTDTKDNAADLTASQGKKAATVADASSPNIKWNSPWNSRENAKQAKNFVEKASPKVEYTIDTPDEHKSGRRHARSTAEDGTTDYQAETMHMNVTAASFDAVSLSDGSDATGPDSPIVPHQQEESRPPNIITGLLNTISKPTRTKTPTSPLEKSILSDGSNVTGPRTPRGGMGSGIPTPRSKAKSLPTSIAATPKSLMEDSSILTQSPTSHVSGVSSNSATNKVITDLIWLEKKIASSKGNSLMDDSVPKETSKDSKHDDSLSFSSGEGHVSPTGSTDSTVELASPNATALTPRKMKSIVCRDCYAPPGKLKIIIHSTKDGPAVHTVKPGSSLQGHIFEGDLIISVDDVDTRSHSAEQVMKMMTSRTRFERKITVLHFEDTS